MKKTADFFEEYEQVKREVERMEVKPEDREQFRRFMEKQKAQQKAEEKNTAKIPDKQRWARVEETYYPYLCRVAEMFGGRAELEIREETLKAELAYIGDTMILVRGEKWGTQTLSAMLEECESVMIWQTEEEGMRLDVYFDLGARE